MLRTADYDAEQMVTGTGGEVKPSGSAADVMVIGGTGTPTDLLPPPPQTMTDAPRPSDLGIPSPVGSSPTSQPTGSTGYGSTSYPPGYTGRPDSSQPASVQLASAAAPSAGASGGAAPAVTDPRAALPFMSQGAMWALGLLVLWALASGRRA